MTHIDILPPSKCRKPASPPDRRFWQMGSFDTFQRWSRFLPFWQMGSFRYLRAKTPGSPGGRPRSDQDIMYYIVVAVAIGVGFVSHVLTFRGDLGGICVGVGFVRRRLRSRAIVAPGRQQQIGNAGRHSVLECIKAWPGLPVGGLRPGAIPGVPAIDFDPMRRGHGEPPFCENGMRMSVEKKWDPRWVELVFRTAMGRCARYPIEINGALLTKTV